MRGKIIKNAIAAAMSIILTVQIAAPGAVFANAYFDDGIVKKSALAGTLVASLEESGESTENATVPNEQDYTDDDFKTSENVYEDISLREEATKYFRHSSGKYTAVVYNEPVHYKDSNGEWQGNIYACKIRRRHQSAAKFFFGTKNYIFQKRLYAGYRNSSIRKRCHIRG